MTRSLLLPILILLSSCGSPEKKEVSSTAKTNVAENAEASEGQRWLGPDKEIPVYDYEGLEPLLHKSGDTTYVVNFWATWCAPCVKELPYFEKVHAERAGEVQVILVNLDMPTMWESRLLPFIAKNQLQSDVVVLDDPRQNHWIPLIDESWSGAIPATLIYRGDQRQFYEQPFTYEGLVQALETFKSPQI